MQTLIYPKTPTKSSTGRVFKRKKNYTIIEKCRVYNLLFETQIFEDDFEQAIKELENKKDSAYKLLFG